jgi:hypothetical protein
MLLDRPPAGQSERRPAWRRQIQRLRTGLRQRPSSGFQPRLTCACFGQKQQKTATWSSASRRPTLDRIASVDVMSETRSCDVDAERLNRNDNVDSEIDGSLSGRSRSIGGGALRRRQTMTRAGAPR